MILPKMVGRSLLWGAWLIPTLFAQGDEVLLQRFQQQYPVALAKLQARYNSMHGQADYTEFRVNADKVREEKSMTFDFAFAPDAAKLSMTFAGDRSKIKQGDPKRLDQIVLGVNPDYAFRLTKRLPTDELGVSEISDDSTKGRLNLLNTYGFEIQCAFNPNQRPLPTWFQFNKIRIDEVLAETLPSGLPSLWVKYTFLPRPESKVLGQQMTGWFVVSPTENWIIRECGFTLVTSKESSTEIARIEYAKSADGQLDPVQQSMRRYSGIVPRGNQNPGNPFFGFDLTFKSVKYQALPQAAFRLPAYGLPEVAEAGKKGAANSRPYGLFALSIVGFGVAGGLKYLSARVKRA